MTVPALLALLTYWEHSPPVHESFARFIGINARSASKGAEEQAQNLADDLRAAGIPLMDGPSWAEQDAAWQAERAAQTTPTIAVPERPHV